MGLKQTAKSSRDALQQGIYVVINPFVRLLIKMGVTPNMVTTIGFLGNVAAAAVLAWTGWQVMQAPGSQPDYALVTLAGALVIGFSLFDMLDGQVARLGAMTSRFGAMYDSVLGPTAAPGPSPGGGQPLITLWVAGASARRLSPSWPSSAVSWCRMCAPVPKASTSSAR